jgi:hypothetical protein
METKDIVQAVLEYLKVLIWPGCVIVGLIIAGPFLMGIVERIKELTVKIRDIVELSIALREEKVETAVPKVGERIVDKEFVKNSFQANSKIAAQGLGVEIDRVYSLLMRSGVCTERQIKELLSDKYIGPLADLYVKILNRPPDKPLDPTAVATYGTHLYQYGVSDTTKSQIENALRNSGEYRRNEIRSVFNRSMR